MPLLSKKEILGKLNDAAKKQKAVNDAATANSQAIAAGEQSGAASSVVTTSPGVSGKG